MSTQKACFQPGTARPQVVYEKGVLDHRPPPIKENLSILSIHILFYHFYHTSIQTMIYSPQSRGMSARYGSQSPAFALARRVDNSDSLDEACVSPSRLGVIYFAPRLSPHL